MPRNVDENPSTVNQGKNASITMGPLRSINAFVLCSSVYRCFMLRSPSRKADWKSHQGHGSKFGGKVDKLRL